jgi:hypothetical protein
VGLREVTFVTDFGPVDGGSLPSHAVGVVVVDEAGWSSAGLLSGGPGLKVVPGS